MSRLLALVALLSSVPAAAEPALDPLFSDHSVLQRGRPIAVWGTAAPRERVTVALGNASACARAGRDGRWRVELPAMTAGRPYSGAYTGAYDAIRTAAVPSAKLLKGWWTHQGSNLGPAD